MTGWIGYNQVPVAYDRDARFAGETKYTTRKHDPLQPRRDLFVLERAAAGGDDARLHLLRRSPSSRSRSRSAFRVAGEFVPGIATVLLVVLLLGGIQLITVGIIGEYLGRVYDEVKRRPLYVVDERRVADPVADAAGARARRAVAVRVAVIGAGIAGLAAGHRLAQGGPHGRRLRALAGPRRPGRDARPRRRHPARALLPPPVHDRRRDRGALRRARDLDAIEWLPSSVGVFAGGRGYAFTSPLDLLRFTAMSLRGRIRMGLATLLLQRRHKEVEPFESVTAHDWVRANMGPEAWDMLWGPLLRGKYGPRADDISMAWLWSKLTLRRRLEGKEARGEMLGYPRGGFEPLLERLRDSIEAAGGRVLIDRPAKSIAAADGGGLRGHGGRAGLVSARPRPARVRARRRARALRRGDRDRARATSSPRWSSRRSRSVSILAASPARRRSSTRRRSACSSSSTASSAASTGPTSPTSALPFIGLIEQTNLIGPEHYGGRHLLYIANYLEPTDPLLDLDYDELVDAYTPGLKLVNPGLRPILDPRPLDLPRAGRAAGRDARLPRAHAAARHGRAGARPREHDADLSRGPRHQLQRRARRSGRRGAFVDARLTYDARHHRARNREA